MPYKKQVLLRWKESNKETDIPLDNTTVHQPQVPPSEPVARDSRKSSIASETTPTSPAAPAIGSSCASPLFEEFSSDDEEFELPRKERKGMETERGSKFSEKGSDAEVGREDEGTEEGPRTPSEGPRTPPLTEGEEPDIEVASNLSTISDTSLHSESRDTVRPTSPVPGQPSTPSPPASPLPPTATRLSPSSANISEPSGVAGEAVMGEEKAPAEPAFEEGGTLGVREETDATSVRRQPQVGMGLSGGEQEESIEEVEMEVSSPAGGRKEQDNRLESDVKVESSTVRTVDDQPREMAREDKQTGSVQEVLPPEGEAERPQEAPKMHPAFSSQFAREQSSGSCSPDARATSSSGGLTPAATRTPGKRKVKE